MAIAQQHQTISSRRQRDMLLTALDLVLAITAVAAIATLILEHGWRAGNHPVDLAKLHAASWLIAGVFAGERFFRLGISHNRSRYARDNWIDFMLIGMAVVAVGVVHRLGDRPLGLNGQATLSAGAMYMLICQLYILGVLLLRAMTLNLRFTESGIHPTWLLILSFAALCLIGSGLLMLPVAIPEPTSPNYLRLDYPDALFTAVSATGNTTIYNSAKEPHIVDVANFLNSMGARIKGAGTDIIRVSGGRPLRGSTYAIIPDQIETGTLMIAAAATGGDVTITGAIPTHMEALTAKLLEMGVRVTQSDDSIRVRPQSEQRAVNVKTQVYPGFPTDLQQPMTALLCMATGTSTVSETIFEQRFKHLDELRRMGAKIKLMDRTVLIEGVRELYGAPVTVTDLRAGAALVVAGLMAKGITEIYETSYIDRGYERIEEKLRSLGADIRREKL